MSLTWFRPEVLWWLAAVPLLVLLPTLLRGKRLRVRPVAATLRTAVLMLLVVAVAGPVVLMDGPRSTTVFLLDRSGSVQESSADAAQGWVQSAIDGAGDDVDVLVTAFGASPAHVSGPSPAGVVDLAPLADGDDVQSGSTDLQAALGQSGALPLGGARVVLLSDGAETDGQAREEIVALRRAGIPVDVVQLSGVEPGEFRVSGISGPAVTWAGSQEQVTAYLESDAAATAAVTLVVDGEIAEEREIALDGASGRAVSFTLPEVEPGFHAIEVRVATDGPNDAVQQNNVWPLGVVVREAPRVAVVSPEGGDSSRLIAAMETRGLAAAAVPSPTLPADAADLAAWDLIVLDNVPAWDLDAATQQALVGYARSGGGVMVVGGTASFGPGAYATTTLETMLPVTVKVTDGRDRPRVAVLLVIDRSGSMSYGESTSVLPKIELAQQGVVTASSALVAGDRVGVIAFNDEPEWALPMTTLEGENPEALIERSISDLHPEGGTELFPALQVAVDGLRNVDADVRHIVVLSDGRSRGADRESYFRLLDDAGAEGISVSTLALGYDADLELLQDLAETGNGRFHNVTDPTQIPRITFEEARAAGSQSVLRGDFAPTQLMPSPIMADVSTAEMPTLDGYNFTGARPGAQVVLVSDRRDPLLSMWQFGLGRVVTWTSDSGTDFAAGWSGWDGYDRFWGNAAAWALPDPANQELTVSVERDAGAGAVLRVDDAAGVLSGDAEMTVTDASGAMVAGPVAPGTVSLPADSGPAWLVTVRDGDLEETHAVTLAPGAEWQPDPDAAALLRDIADGTDGRLLDLDADPGSVMTPTDRQGALQETRAVWWVPAGLAVVVFLADIALRLGVRFRR